MKTTGNTIIITGGGTGIGEALARFHDLGRNNGSLARNRRTNPAVRAALDMLSQAFESR